MPLRHSGGDHVDVTLDAQGRRGGPAGQRRRRGFDPRIVRRAGRPLGLVSMRDRASGVGGRLTVESAPARAPRSRWRSPWLTRSRCCWSTITRWYAGLRTFLEVQDDIEVVGEAADGAEGVALAGSWGPTSSSWTSRCPAWDGVDALRRLRELEHPARVLIVT
ncbi:hypothetical protein GCM10023238_02700 [Streptomyces heliomycini]